MIIFYWPFAMFVPSIILCNFLLLMNMYLLYKDSPAYP